MLPPAPPAAAAAREDAPWWCGQRAGGRAARPPPPHGRPVPNGRARLIWAEAARSLAAPPGRAEGAALRGSQPPPGAARPPPPRPRRAESGAEPAALMQGLGPSALRRL